MATVGELINKDKNVDIGIVLDESGSMSDIKETVVKCFNDFIKEQKQQGDDAYITLTKFNTYVNIEIDRKKINKAKSISYSDYNPNGTTALYDAIFDTIKKIESKNKNNNVIIAVITDGYENASKKCDIKSLKEMIKSKEGLGWRFLFLASNIDVEKVSSSMGFNPAFSMSFMSTNDGYKNMSCHVTGQVSSYRNLVKNI